MPQLGMESTVTIMQSVFN